MFVSAMLIIILTLTLLAPYLAYDLELLTSQEYIGYKLFRVLLAIATLSSSIGYLIIFDPPQTTSWVIAIILSLVIYATDTIPFVRKLFS